MTEPDGESSPAPDRPGVSDMLRAAVRLMREHPRESMLPLAVVQVPLVLGTIVATVLLYNTAFADEVYPRGGLVGVDAGGGPLFAVVMLAAIALLFSLVGWSATIVAAARLAQGEHVSLSQALDPAFTRLGGLVVLVFLILGGAVVLAFSIVGLLALPYLAIRFGVAFQVYLLEEAGPIAALRGSWEVMKGNMLRLLAIVLVGAGLALLLGVLVPAGLGPDDASRSTRMAVDALLQVIQGAFAIPAAVFAHTVTTIYYLRIREARA